MFAEALVDALGASTELQVVGLATQVDEARDLLEGQDVDVILVDPSTVPGLCWSDLRRWAGRGCIAVLADEMTEVGAVAVHGVRGWFGKNQELSVLVDTLPGLASGLACFPPERLRLELDDLTRRLEDLERGITTFSRLTPREREVLSCLLDGRERREIAGELHLSPDTVRTHVEHLLVKIGAHSTLSAVALAHRYGWDGLLHLREEKRCVPADVGFFGNG
jgi:DNA-binding NarL/FixJ family response regulator